MVITLGLLGVANIITLVMAFSAIHGVYQNRQMIATLAMMATRNEESKM